MVTNKKELYFKCLEKVNGQIKKYQEQLDTIKESMDTNDIKTDYDDDNRGQLLGDFEKYAAYLNKSREMKETLTQIDQEHYSETITFGSIVETDKNYYFIAAPLGELELSDGSIVHAISTEAPIYSEMQGKKAGEKFFFTDQEYKIINLQ